MTDEERREMQRVIDSISELHARIDALRDEIREAGINLRTSEPAPAPAWWTVKGMARQMGVDRESVMRMVRAGQLVTRGSGAGLRVRSKL